MRKAIKYFLMLLWLFSFSIAFLMVWLRTPALWLSNLPDETYVSLMRAFNVRGAEDAMDLEMDIALGLGFVLASIILALFLFVRKRKSRTHGNQ